MPTDYEREVLREFLATHQSPKEKAAQEDQPRIWGDSGSKRIAELEAQVAALQAERDSEERWADQYSKQVDALKAELLASTSQVTRLTQEANRLDAELKAARAALDFHPRAAKLMRKGKSFIVIAIDEPYFEKAYRMIRTEELEHRRWTTEDETLFQELTESALSAARARRENEPEQGVAP